MAGIIITKDTASRKSIQYVNNDIVDATTNQQISHVDQYVIGGATTIYNLLVSNTANGYYVGHCSQQT